MKKLIFVSISCFMAIFVLFLNNFAVFHSSVFAIECKNNYQTSAEAMALIESNSGRIIACKNADKKLPMASLTKIITAIVAIENNNNLDEVKQVPDESVGIEGSSIYIKKGEHLTLRELLYGLMLRSGNDAAVAISILTSGSVEGFIKLCNDFCFKHGLENTHLVTPSGLHDDNHYTTASDLAKITAYAMHNSTFAEIVATTRKNIPAESTKEGYRNLKNKNRFLSMLDGADGVKTGFTKKAGRCFVGSCTREEDGMQLVCVLLNCGPMFQECKSLITQGFSDYKLYNLYDGDKYKIEIDKDGNFVSGETQQTLLYPLSEDEMKNVEIKEKILWDGSLPVKINQKIAELEIFVDKNLILCDNIYSLTEINDIITYREALEKAIENF